MAPAFMGCVSFAMRTDDCVAAFLTEHPGCTPPATPIARMIDEASGRVKAIAATFADWVVETLWGEEGQEQTEEHIVTREVADYAQVMKGIEMLKRETTP